MLSYTYCTFLTHFHNLRWSHDVGDNMSNMIAALANMIAIEAQGVEIAL